ncbi:SpoIIE family protein phosphatase [Verrucomicrobiaceae bacterium 5K15]|uniref:SpoIIE family protein phosphatase n=1 Tax=Oceaniferula flava TaxID=2800421 RepID=A0AAE2SCG5_9BACT|nr:SpoIIE family protein phosphatase [Oceaniferula flavus]MBK1855661.1 SpoIIE family protein phosphatase [Oceaniferula flavus]MBM1136967.1 SpoIIE family protein phosphatase [Oceaniferula flavus]
MKPKHPSRLELALQASNEGVWDWYVDEEEIYYSDRVLGFLGYPRDEAPNILKHSDRYIHEDDQPELQKAISEVLSESAPDTLATDCRYRHPDGSWHWLRIRGVLVPAEDGSSDRIVGSVIDISRRKNAETALDEERHRLHELIENIPVNVYYKDTDSKFVLANSSTAKKLGAESVQDLIGKSDHDFFDARHADVARANELEIMETQKPQIKVIQCETWEDRENTWAETSKLPWLDRKGNLRGTFGVTSDITDLVRSQRMLTSLAEELQSRYTAVEEELHLAREIQQALLPQSLEGLTLCDSSREVSFGCRYAPASEMAGDFYEVIPISQHSIGFFIGDVMGHGVRASLVVSMLRGLMEKEREAATDPEWFLYGINEGLVSILERANVTLFATAIYCVVNLKEGTLRYSCAGHPTPITVRLGKAQQLKLQGKETNPALGLIPGTPFKAEKLSLDEIDRLLVFTDGLHEVENEHGEPYGVERIIAQLEDHADEELSTCLDRIIAEAKAFSKTNEFDDDVCLLAMDVGSGL